MFKVLNSQGRFDDVQASVRMVSGQAVLYVDDAAPGGGFTEADCPPSPHLRRGHPPDGDAGLRSAFDWTPTSAWPSCSRRR